MHRIIEIPYFTGLKQLLLYDYLLNSPIRISFSSGYSLTIQKSLTLSVFFESDSQLYQLSSKAMIVIKQAQDEEIERFIPIDRKDKKKEAQASIKIKSFLNSNKDQIKVISFVVLIVLTLFKIYENYDLKARLEQYRYISDEALLVQSFNHEKCLPTAFIQESKVEESEIYKFQILLMHYLTPFTDTNCQLKRYGIKKDGGYVLCENFIEPSSVLLNFGISDEDSFGCSLANSHNITNYQFDCTLNETYLCLSETPKFSKICLGDKNSVIGGREYSKYEQIIEKFHISNEHIIVKIDIEGNQWFALPQISIAQLEQIDQLVVELHFSKANVGKGENWEYIAIVKRLLSKFIPVNVHMNNFGCYGIYKDRHYLGSNSIEVTFINRKLIHLNSYQRSFSLSKQNYPNEPYYVDCQMAK